MAALNQVIIRIVTCAYLTISSRPGVFTKPTRFGGPTTARLSLADWESYNLRDIDGSPGTYAFGYDVEDTETGNTQYRDEQRYPNGTVVGSYGYVDAHGHPVQVRYIADEKGYRIITNNRKTDTWNSHYADTNTNKIHHPMMNQARPSIQTPPYLNHYPGIKMNSQNKNNYQNYYNMNTLPIIYAQQKKYGMNSEYDTSQMSEMGERGHFNIAMKDRTVNKKFGIPSSKRNHNYNSVLYTPLYNIPA